jgi:hypothetical protein
VYLRRAQTAALRIVPQSVVALFVRFLPHLRFLLPIELCFAFYRSARFAGMDNAF